MGNAWLVSLMIVHLEENILELNAIANKASGITRWEASSPTEISIKFKAFVESTNREKIFRITYIFINLIENDP